MMKKGFTLVELILVMAIVLALLSFVYFDFIGAQRKASINSVITLLISDLKSQQIKAMVGENGGAAVASISGVHIDTSIYTLFVGSEYSPTHPNNVVVPVDGPQLSSTFPNSTIFFATGSGEIMGFSDGSDTITISHLTSNESKVIKLNRYGVVTSVN